MRLSVAAATALLLAACGQTTTPSVPPATGGAQVPSAQAGAATAPVQARYAIGDTEVVFRHALRLADADGRLRLLLTPGPLPEEKSCSRACATTRPPACSCSTTRPRATRTAIRTW